MSEMRIGHGYDVHKLVSERKLILGGVEVPHTLGLLGHSDADVLLHAIMDAILGALALGDIGKHFPDTDDKYKGISSMHLLTCVNKLLHENGGSIVNVDATLILQKPKVAPYIEKMRETGNWKIANEYENVGKGYIKGLVDCGVIDNFKITWCWFTV